MAERIWDNTHVIGEAMVSERTKVVVNASIRDGVKYITLKGWYQKKDGAWMPGMDWICFGTNVPKKDGSGALPDPTLDILKFISAAATELETMPLYDEANVVYKKEK